MPQVTKIEAPNHTPEQVAEIIQQAIKIANEYQPLQEHWQYIFEQACLLLGQKSVSFVAEQAVPFVPPQLNHKAHR